MLAPKFIVAVGTIELSIRPFKALAPSSATRALSISIVSHYKALFSLLI